MDTSETSLLGEVCSAACALIWACAMIMFKKASEQVNPISLNLFKNVLALLLCLPTSLLAGGRLFPDDPLWHYGIAAISGIVGIGLADTLFFMCLARLGATLTAIVDCLYTPFVMGLAFFLFGERTGLATVAGGALIIAAILFGSLRWSDFKGGLREKVVGIVLGAISMLLVAFGIIIIKKPLWGHPPVLEASSLMWVTSFRLLAGTLSLLVFIAIQRSPAAYFACFRPSGVWKAMVPASLLGSYFSMIVWLVGWKYTPTAGVAAVLNQLTLIFVMVLASLFLGERFTARRAAAVGLAMAGGVVTVVF